MGAATTETFATAGIERKDVMSLREYVDLVMTLDLVTMMGSGEAKDCAVWLGTQMSRKTQERDTGRD